MATVSEAPLASVIVPVHDGAAWLPALMAALDAQDVPGGLEVVAIDSGSRDDSAAILESTGARVLRVPAASFDHGQTRNLGAAEARGRYAMFLSQDALPTESSFVRRLLGALEAEPRLAGVFARQVPRADADPLTRRDLGSWVAAAREPRAVFLDRPEDLDRLAPLERYRLSVFDNVASAARRELLLAHPFRSSRFGEDVEWGQRMLRLGYGLGYVPEAAVLHSHPRTALGLLRRNYLGHRALFRWFGLRAIPDRRHLLRAVAGSLASDLGTLGREGAAPAAFLAAPLQALAASYGQYRGARDERLARAYPAWA